MKLIKIFGILSLVMCLVLGTISPVLATNNSVIDQSVVSSFKDKGKEERTLGKVKVVRGIVDNVTGDSIWIDGKEIVTDGKTKYKIPTMGKTADIEAGMQIVAQCNDKDGQFLARQIVVIPGKPTYRHHVGEVVAYYPGDNITIKDKSGVSTTFKVGDKFTIKPKGATLEAGDWVTVVSHRDPAQDRLIADGVVVHPEKHINGPKSMSDNFTSITDNITNISGTATSGNITVGSTVINLNADTIFVLRGALGLQVGQMATVFYHQDGSMLLAKWVLVGINMPEALQHIGKYKEETEDED